MHGGQSCDDETLVDVPRVEHNMTGLPKDHPNRWTLADIAPFPSSADDEQLARHVDTHQKTIESLRDKLRRAGAAQATATRRAT